MNRLQNMIRGLALAVAMSCTAEAAGPAAVVLMYHRFGEDDIPSTNIRLDQLDQHIGHLKAGGFHVAPLADVVAALETGSTLPDKTVAITIDDSYASVVEHAWPRFKRAGFPFTVFVATAALDRRERRIMSWDQLRALADDGVGIGGHGHAHAHMPALSDAAVSDDLALMNRRFEEELGVRPTLFAYPFGEAADSDKAAVKAAGFIAAFGTNSGPAYAEADRFFLPRFALNENYGVMDRFKLVVATRPLRAVGLSPSSPVLQDNPPALSFRIVDAPPLGGLACYGPGGGRVPIEISGDAVSIRPADLFPAGRARVNCTIRADGQWYWWGHEMVSGGISEGVRVHPRHLASRGD